VGKKLNGIEEGLRDLRSEVEELHQENLALKAAAKETANNSTQAQANHRTPHSPQKTGEIRKASNLNNRVSMDSLNAYSFAEPTEAEYLRNVLFRYMTERETLGKEIVTLARVIGTVAKFSNDQLNLVLKREESRQHQRWLSSSSPHHS